MIFGGEWVNRIYQLVKASLKFVWNLRKEQKDKSDRRKNEQPILLLQNIYLLSRFEAFHSDTKD
ncbi:hypothetical protein LJC28_03995 [Dysgonomonas sp. OttesenSCG-928-D17]|nr:hypothetical protein [Dysgonomonas sp. OttesenSCG-928-D17]